MADTATILKDPNFTALPLEERRKVLSTVDRNFGMLPTAEQNKVFGVAPPPAPPARQPSSIHFPLLGGDPPWWKSPHGVMTATKSPVFSGTAAGRPGELIDPSVDNAVSIPLRNSQGPLTPQGLDVPMGKGARVATAPLRFFGGAAEQTGQGLTQMGNPQSFDEFAGGVSNTAKGTGKMMLPFAGPAIAAHPVASLVGAGAGAATGAGTEGLSRALGVPPGMSDLLGTIVGAITGYGTLKGVTGLKGTVDAARAKAENADPEKLKTALINLIPGFGPKINAVRSALEPVPPQAPEPFSPSPGTSRTLRFGGPPPPGYSPSSTSPATGWKAPTESMVPGPEDIGPQPPEPFKFKPNPKVARLIKSKGSGDTESGMPTSTRSREPVRRPSLTPPPVPPPPGAQAMPSAPEATHTDLTRQIHATGREMELPGSPKGQPIHVSPTAQEIYGKGWTDLSVPQKQAITEFLHSNKRLPTAADVKSGTFKK